MQAWATLAHRTDSALFASAITLTEVTDGSTRDAVVRRTVKALRIQPVTASTGYTAGGLRARASSKRKKPRDLTVDAVVAATALALAGPVIVLTSDPADLRLLLGGSSIRVESIS